jgi:hypothetical protein
MEVARRPIPPSLGQREKEAVSRRNFGHEWKKETLSCWCGNLSEIPKSLGYFLFSLSLGLENDRFLEAKHDSDSAGEIVDKTNKNETERETW